MDRQTPEEGWQELQAHIEGFFDQVLRVEREKALLSRKQKRPEAREGQWTPALPGREGRQDAEEEEPFRSSFEAMGSPQPCAF